MTMDHVIYRVRQIEAGVTIRSWYELSMTSLSGRRCV